MSHRLKNKLQFKLKLILQRKEEQESLDFKKLRKFMGY